MTIRQHVLVLSADRPIPRAVRDTIRQDGHYVFESGIDNLQKMLRTVFVDAIVVVGEVPDTWRARLRADLSGGLLERTVFVDRSDAVPAAVASLAHR